MDGEETVLHLSRDSQVRGLLDMPSGPQDNQAVLQGKRLGRRDRRRCRLLTRCGPVLKRGTSGSLPILRTLPALPSRASSCPVLVLSCRVLSEPRRNPWGHHFRGQLSCRHPLLSLRALTSSYPNLFSSCIVLSDSCRTPWGHHHRGQYSRCHHALPSGALSCPVLSYWKPKGLHGNITAEVSPAAASTHCSRGPCPVLSCPVGVPVGYLWGYHAEVHRAATSIHCSQGP